MSGFLTLPVSDRLHKGQPVLNTPLLPPLVLGQRTRSNRHSTFPRPIHRMRK